MGQKLSQRTPASLSNTVTPVEVTTINQVSHVVHPDARRSSLVYSNIVQNFVLVWFNENDDEINNTYFLNSTKELQRIIHTIDKFHNIEECINYLKQITNEKIFVIISETSSQEIIPHIHHLTQLNSIYILCKNKSQYTHSTERWSKVKGIYSYITPICEDLEQAAQQCDRNSIPISFVPISNDIDDQDCDRLDQTYMYTQLLKEDLFDIEYNGDSVKNFVTYCHDSSYGNLKVIEKFSEEYYIQTPIYWYTYPAFLSPILNRALRTLEVETIINLGFFIRDLNCHIKKLYVEQFADKDLPSFTVYRGQGLSQIDFEKLMKTNGGLIAFNSFLSTSTNRDVSFSFADSNRHDKELVGIVFQMTIDPSISSTPFAWIGNVSYYKQQEQEVLFSMHTIFRIIDIKSIDHNNRLWQVELKLTNETDNELRLLTNKIRTETQGSTRLNRLASLLIKLGHSDKAEQIYRLLLNQTPNEVEKAHLYNQIGNIKNHQADYMNAMIYYKKALKIYRNIFPSDNIFLACSYNNIGQIHQPLDIKKRILPPDHPNLAESFRHIGLLHDKLGEYSQALLAHRTALQIRQKHLPSIHPTLAHTYKNTASVCYNMGAYSKAFSYYTKAHAIFDKTLPRDHPDLAQSYGHMGTLHDKMGNYSQALMLHEKALEIRQKKSSISSSICS